MSSSATFFIDPVPELGADVRQFVVDCYWATSRFFHAPGRGWDFDDVVLASLALQHHEDHCGKCDLSGLWRRHGDRTFKRLVGASWECLGTMRAAERRN